MSYPTTLYMECSVRSSRRLSPAERAWTEAKSQRAVIRYLASLPEQLLHRLDYLHVPNEGKRSRRGGADLKAQGLTPGAADLIVMRAGIVRGYAFSSVVIELKRANGTGRVTPAQLAFLERRRETGAIAEVCHGHLEAIELLHACYGW